MKDDLQAVRALLPEVAVEQVQRLRGSERCTVDRIHLSAPGAAPTTAVVKRFLTPGEGWVREVAALEALPPGLAPSLLAVGEDPQIVVMSDLGDGPGVADAVLGRDPVAAGAAVRAWAQALARLHVAAAAPLVHERFVAALAARQGQLLVPHSRVTGELADAGHALDDRCANLGVTIPSGALDELRGLGHRLGSGCASLSPVDTCPDDTVLIDGQVRLVDFEGAQWRHVAWDVAYLLVPWPTCWCSWRMPDTVAAAALDAYCAVAAEGFPEVADESFRRDVRAAAAAWALTSTTWFLDFALGADPDRHPDRPTPTRRAMILHRLDGAGRCEELPALGDLARRLAAELHRRWGEVPLDLAPAFSGT